jgi:hypothetical protein
LPLREVERAPAPAHQRAEGVVGDMGRAGHCVDSDSAVVGCRSRLLSRCLSRSA